MISTSAVISLASWCCPMDMVRHGYLAVLTVITVLAAALIFAAARRRLRRPQPVLVAVSAFGGAGTTHRLRSAYPALRIETLIIAGLSAIDCSQFLRRGTRP